MKMYLLSRNKHQKCLALNEVARLATERKEIPEDMRKSNQLPTVKELRKTEGRYWPLRVYSEIVIALKLTVKGVCVNT